MNGVQCAYSGVNHARITSEGDYRAEIATGRDLLGTNLLDGQ
jgi:hypothetical protein